MGANNDLQHTMYQFRVVVYVLKWDLELEKKLKKERKKEIHAKDR